MSPRPRTCSNSTAHCSIYGRDLVGDFTACGLPVDAVFVQPLTRMGHVSSWRSVHGLEIMRDGASAWSIWRHREWCLISTTNTLRLCGASPRTLRVVTLSRSAEAKYRQPSRFGNMGAFLRLRDARQSEGLSRSAWVATHQ